MYIAEPIHREPDEEGDSPLWQREKAKHLDRERREFIRTAAIHLATMVGSGGRIYSAETTVERAQELWAAIHKAGC